MRAVRLSFEVRLLLIFGALLLVVFFFGPGNLSFEQARAKADAHKLSLSPRQSNKLDKAQASFTEVAFPACLEATGKDPENVSIVIEVGENGQVARSWRAGDSAIAVCLQRLMTEHFFYISIQRPFFTLFEFGTAG